MLRKNTGLMLLLMLFAGCAFRDVEIPFIPGLGPHKIDIQQGNVVTKDMLDKLQPGMTRNQVRFVLGTPLLVDPFRNDRWDYTYSLNKAGERIEPRLLKVFFKDDKMVRYEGDVVADAKAGTAATKPAAVDVKPKDKPAADAKPAVVEPAPAAPASATPARDAAEDAKLKLRLTPSEGEPAKPAERAPEPPPVAAQQPAPSEPLEAPPLPRLVLPPEPEQKPGPPATTPDTPSRP
jgi:outer membrane protein assembly factor BamE